jgi:hypothetical protein
MKFLKALAALVNPAAPVVHEQRFTRRRARRQKILRACGSNVRGW